MVASDNNWDVTVRFSNGTGRGFQRSAGLASKVLGTLAVQKMLGENTTKIAQTRSREPETFGGFCRLYFCGSKRAKDNK
jgi:hypothetical protein